MLERCVGLPDTDSTSELHDGRYAHSLLECDRSRRDRSRETVGNIVGSCGCCQKVFLVSIVKLPTDIPCIKECKYHRYREDILEMKSVMVLQEA